MKSPIEFFEAHLAAEEMRPATVVQYGSFLRRFERYLKQQHGLDLSAEGVRKVSGLHLSAYMQELSALERQISTRNNYIVILKCFLRHLLQIGAIDSDPSLALHCIREKNTPQALERRAAKRYSNEQLSTLLTAFQGKRPRLTDLRDAAVLALILGSGLRAFEACALNVRQAEEIRGGVLFCLRKGGNWAHVSVAGYVAAYIDRYLYARGSVCPDDPLFVSQKGGRLDRKALWSALAAKQSRLDLQTGVHIFRHTLLTAIDHDGGSALARDVGGHKSVQITNQYMHPSMDERLEAVNATPYAALLVGSGGK